MGGSEFSAGNVDNGAGFTESHGRHDGLFCFNGAEEIRGYLALDFIQASVRELLGGYLSSSGDK